MLSADARHSTSRNSAPYAHGEAHSARTQATSQRVPAAQAQRTRADQSAPASSYQQNQPSQRQSSLTNQVAANAGVQRAPYIPPVSTCV